MLYTEAILLKRLHCGHQNISLEAACLLAAFVKALPPFQHCNKPLLSSTACKNSGCSTCFRLQYVHGSERGSCRVFRAISPARVSLLTIFKLC